MKITNSQQDIVFDLSTQIKNVGIKISGGADSAIVCYILSQYVATERSDITIVPITVDQIGKRFQLINSQRVIEYCRNKFGDIFSRHYNETATPETVIDVQNKLLKQLYLDNTIDCHYSGITMNPPDNAIPSLVYEQGFKLPRPETGIIDRSRDDKLKPTSSGRSYYPLLNIDKQGVAELYNTLNVLEELFPLTRSCESLSDDINYHCHECWFCNERFWGFNRYA